MEVVELDLAWEPEVGMGVMELDLAWGAEAGMEVMELDLAWEQEVGMEVVELDLAWGAEAGMVVMESDMATVLVVEGELMAPAMGPRAELAQLKVPLKLRGVPIWAPLILPAVSCA